MPASAKPDARRIVVGRALRGFIDGSVSVGLSTYLGALGLGAFEIGAIVTGTLLGSAALTLVVGIAGHGWSRRSVLLGASLLMAATGLGFAVCRQFVPLLLVAVIGTLNPSSGDVSVFLPYRTSGAWRARWTPGKPPRSSRATTWRARSPLPRARSRAGSLPSRRARSLATSWWRCAHSSSVTRRSPSSWGRVYLGLSREPERAGESHARMGERTDAASRPLARSRRVVLKLAALFSLDSLGGGFRRAVAPRALAVEAFRAFITTMGTVFFASGLLAFVFAARVGAPRRPRRTRPDHGVHPHSGQRSALLAGLMPTAPLGDRGAALAHGRSRRSTCPRASRW